MTKRMTKEIRSMPRMKGLVGLKRDSYPNQGRNMPKEVDIVTAKDIYCGDYSGGNGFVKHCLLGLSLINFGTRVQRGGQICTVSQFITKESRYINKELEKSVRAFTGNDSLEVHSFNDEIMGPENKHWIAKVWNATMARVGYTEGNPQA